MKRPKIDNLANFTPSSDRFTEKLVEVKEAEGKTQPKTYSLSKKSIKYINTKAAELAAIQEKPISASSALKTLLDEHRAFKAAQS